MEWTLDKVHSLEAVHHWVNCYGFDLYEKDYCGSDLGLDET